MAGKRRDVRPPDAPPDPRPVVAARRLSMILPDSQKTLRQLQDEIGAWGDTTFPTSNAFSVASHFEEEAAEFLAEIRTGDSVGAVLFELADCFILLMQFAHKNGFDIAEIIEQKMAVNRARVWNTTPEPGGHFKHVEAV